MREICKSGSEGGAGHTNAPSLPLSNIPRDFGPWIRYQPDVDDEIPCHIGRKRTFTSP